MILIFALIVSFSIFSYACWITGEKSGRKFVARVISYELEDCSYTYSKHPGGIYRRLVFVLDKYL